MVYRDPPPAGRVCPRCDSALARRRIEDVTIDECARCLGLFLDHAAVKQIVADRDESRAGNLLDTLPSTPTTTPIPTSNRMYVKCPVCTTLMNRKLFAGGSGVIIDICRDHGVYFDVGELPRIVTFVMSGGLEVAQKREAERMKHEEKERANDARFHAMMEGRSSTHALRGSQANRNTALLDFLFTLFDRG